MNYTVMYDDFCFGSRHLRDFLSQQFEYRNIHLLIKSEQNEFDRRDRALKMNLE